MHVGQHYMPLSNIQTHDVDVVDSIHATVAQNFNSNWMHSPDCCPARSAKFRPFCAPPLQNEPPGGGFVSAPRTGNGLLERTLHTMDVDTWPQQSPEPGVSGLTMSFVKHKWEPWHQFKKFQPCSQFTVFRCWMQITQFAQIKRSQAKLVKQAKQQRFDTVLLEADEATL